MNTLKEIEITCCDFCVHENCDVWKCGLCHKDACSDCCQKFRLFAARPRRPLDGYAILHHGTGGERQVLQGHLCNQCASGSVANMLARLGFERPEALPREDAR